MVFDYFIAGVCAISNGMAIFVQTSGLYTMRKLGIGMPHELFAQNAYERLRGKEEYHLLL